MISNSDLLVEGEIMPDCNRPVVRLSWGGEPRQVTAPVGISGDIGERRGVKKVSRDN